MIAAAGLALTVSLRCRRQSAMVMPTDEDGLVSVRTDGRRLFVETGK